MKKTEFYNAETDRLEFIPFDIETTGFKAAEDDFITTFVLHHETTYHVWINTSGSVVEASEIHAEVEEKSGIGDTLIHVCENEKSLLQNVGDYLDRQTGDMAILTAFNGETYRGDTDFDIPFLRTRCFRCGVRWIFEGYWYSDIYEVFSQDSRFDTTVKAEPSLEDMKKTDIQQFADDMGFDIHYSNMRKAELVRALESHNGVTIDMLQSWAVENNVVEEPVEESESFRQFIKSNGINKSPLQDFVDDMSVDISYDKLSVDELVREIRERGYEEDMLIEWHKRTGRKIGTEEVGTLDEIHKVMVEDNLHERDWRRNLPFDLEVFTPFDPFEDSGEAVTSYKEDDFVGVILHCFADVARTVNLNRVMAEYAPKTDYEPKIL